MRDGMRDAACAIWNVYFNVYESDRTFVLSTTADAT